MRGEERERLLVSATLARIVREDDFDRGRVRTLALSQGTVIGTSRKSWKSRFRLRVASTPNQGILTGNKTPANVLFLVAVQCLSFTLSLSAVSCPLLFGPTQCMERCGKNPREWLREAPTRDRSGQRGLAPMAGPRPGGRGPGDGCVEFRAST